MAMVLLVFDHSEAQRKIPYQMVCEGRNSARWNTMRRRRRWSAEFTETERKAASRLFKQACRWTLVRGVPAQVRMTPATYDLWCKLGDFCASL